MTETVLLSVEQGIATITLNRPEAMNALNLDMADALTAVTRQVAEDGEARCVVLRGAGAHFMAGGDLKVFEGLLQSSARERRDFLTDLIGRVHPAVLTLRETPKPVLVSLRGAAAGFGLSLSLAADLAVAAEGTTFTLAYSRIGTSPDGGSSHTLPRLVGLRKAMEIALLSERFDAATAERLGLVNWVVPDAELESETAKIAKRLAEGPAEALARTKQLLSDTWSRDLEEQLEAERIGFGDCAASDDFVEGVASFLEKRPPRFGQTSFENSED